MVTHTRGDGKIGGKSAFVKAGNGKFDLRSRGQADDDPCKNEKCRHTAKSLFAGAAGGHGVESELLFRNYDASMTSVDRSVDIVARKGGHVFDIQVKTMGRHPTGAYIASIRKKAFDANRS